MVYDLYFMRFETFQAPRPSAYRIRKGLACIILAGTAACSSSPEGSTAAEAHFSVVCPSGGSPAIEKVAHSGALPKDPEGKMTQGVVELVCPNPDEDTVVRQDTEHNGDCLGYGKESHLVVRAEQPGLQGPAFFVADYPAVGVAGSDRLFINYAGIHHHDLSDPMEQAQYSNHHCGEK